MLTVPESTDHRTIYGDWLSLSTMCAPRIELWSLELVASVFIHQAISLATYFFVKKQFPHNLS